jgi:tetratricopeptide (TPR) repeat protein
MNKNFAFFSNIVCGITFCTMVAMPTAFAETSAGGSENPAAQKHFDSGTAKNDAKDYAGAIAEFNQAIAIDPNYGKAFGNRASARFNAGDYNGAIHDLDVALRFYPNMPALVSLRERARNAIDETSQSQQQAASQRAYANRLLQQAILGGDMADPSTIIMMRAQQNGLINSGPRVNPFANNPLVVNQGSGGQVTNPLAPQQSADTNSASSKLEAMTQDMSPDSEEPSQPSSAGSDDSSGQSASTGQPSSPVQPPSGGQLSSRQYFTRGCEKSKATNYAAAIPDFSKCIEQEPNFGDAYANRGLARFHTQDFQGALQDFQAADRLIPNNQELKRYIDLSRQALKSPSTF